MFGISSWQLIPQRWEHEDRGWDRTDVALGTAEHSAPVSVGSVVWSVQSFSVLGVWCVHSLDTCKIHGTSSCLCDLPLGGQQPRHRAQHKGDPQGVTVIVTWMLRSSQTDQRGHLPAGSCLHLPCAIFLALWQSKIFEAHLVLSLHWLQNQPFLQGAL